MRTNTYGEYSRWGSIAHPARTTLHYALNWLFLYGAFYLIGGHALATALFGWSAVWAVGIRAHNYDLHAGGKDRRRDGLAFDRKSLAINQLWPGFVAGEWHNNHHLFPNSARAGFLPRTAARSAHAHDDRGTRAVRKDLQDDPPARTS